MRASLDARIARATELAQIFPAARDLLIFYRELARLQKPIFEQLRDRTDLGVLVPHFPALLELVRRSGPEPLAEFGSKQLGSPEAQENLLRAGWEGAVDSEAPRFYARVLLQPYAESLASRGVVDIHTAASVCPFCGSRPVAAALRGEGDGGKRWLVCSLCSTEWEFRRVVCPNCAEEDKEKLPVFTSSEIEHVRVEACDSCKTYLKSVDLTKDGRAVPMVDEIATVALNIWAETHGYTKLESNLLGM